MLFLIVPMMEMQNLKLHKPIALKMFVRNMENWAKIFKTILEDLEKEIFTQS